MSRILGFDDKTDDKMLVIHSGYRRTGVHSILYQGLAARVVDGQFSNHDMNEWLRQSPPHERIMLLGKGFEDGLCGPDEEQLIVAEAQADLLRDHGNELVALWWQSDRFARKHGLHGLFVGRLITDKNEAESYGIITLQHHIDEANEVMFSKLRALLDGNVPLCDIPARMKSLMDVHSCVGSINYKRFHYL